MTGRNKWSDLRGRMSPERDARIKARVAELSAELDALRDLREALGISQVELASALDTTQPAVSKVEKREDVKLSTLRSYIEALGGKLELTVHLPDKSVTLRRYGTA